MLILFDIDGTLLRSERAGIKAMTVAMNEVYPPRHEGDLSDAEAIDSPGWLDPLIWEALMEQRGLEKSKEGHDAFRSAYGRIFNAVIRERNPVHALPGAEAAVRWVHEHPEYESALLTGNYPETGTLKVEAAGIDPAMFRFGTWGSEAESRRGLPPVAIDKALRELDRTFSAQQTIIVGDTPADIDCAHANGCRCISVATGHFSDEELASHHPDRLMRDLSNLDEFKDALSSFS